MRLISSRELRLREGAERLTQSQTVFPFHINPYPRSVQSVIGVAVALHVARIEVDRREGSAGPQDRVETDIVVVVVVEDVGGE